MKDIAPKDYNLPHRINISNIIDKLKNEIIFEIITKLEKISILV